jgi:hypothetical protein
VTGRGIELWFVLLAGAGWALVGLFLLSTGHTRTGVIPLVAAAFTRLGLLTGPRPDEGQR